MRLNLAKKLEIIQKLECGLLCYNCERLCDHKIKEHEVLSHKE